VNSFDLTIVAGTKVCFRGQARICTIFSTTGARSFEARHEPFMAVLVSPSAITFREATGQENRIEVADGVVSFVQNRCTILVSPGVPSPRSDS